MKKPYERVDDQREILARMVIVEHARGTLAEWAGMMQVAINRAEKWGATCTAVIRSKVKHRPVWSARREEYDRRLVNVAEDAILDDARMVASSVICGKNEDAQKIGPRRNFLHPGSMKTLPAWAISKNQGGSATFEPILIEKTLFC